MRYKKTVKILIHHDTTDRKLSYLSNLTARQTYAVQLFCENLNEEGIVPKYRYGVPEFSDYVREETGLSAGFIQQAEDKVLCMYKQYKSKRSHDKWERVVNNAKEGTRWYKKLKEREPSVPNPKKNNSKVSTPFDNRTGKVQKTDELDLTKWIVHISTLNKGETIDVLLNPSEWHQEQLEKAKNLKTFEIVHHPKRDCEYMVHISCEYKSDTLQTGSVCGVDLVKRDLSAVLIDDNSVEQFTIMQNDK
ncbi:MAG: hypothetical protein ACOC40_01950 [Thermoplasmatota archaeon]